MRYITEYFTVEREIYKKCDKKLKKFCFAHAREDKFNFPVRKLSTF